MVQLNFRLRVRVWWSDVVIYSSGYGELAYPLHIRHPICMNFNTAIKQAIIEYRCRQVTTLLYTHSRSSVIYQRYRLRTWEEKYKEWQNHSKFSVHGKSFSAVTSYRGYVDICTYTNHVRYLVHCLVQSAGFNLLNVSVNDTVNNSMSFWIENGTSLYLLKLVHHVKVKAHKLIYCKILFLNIVNLL